MVTWKLCCWQTSAYSILWRGVQDCSWHHNNISSLHSSSAVAIGGDSCILAVMIHRLQMHLQQIECMY